MPGHDLDARKEYLAYARMNMQIQESYDNHKEGSAWLAAAAYVTAGANVVFRELPQVRVAELGILFALAIWVVFLMGATLIFWQLRRRHESSVTSQAWVKVFDAQLARMTHGEVMNTAELAEYDIAKCLARRDAGPILGEVVIDIIVILVFLVCTAKLFVWGIVAQ